MIDSVFTKNEVLISCPSIGGLDLSCFPNYKCNTTNNLWIDENELLIFIQKLSKNAQSQSNKIAKLATSQSRNKKLSDILVNIFLNRRYRRGSRQSNFPEMIEKKCQHYISNDLPIELTISLFPCKIPNHLKTDGIFPDLAELLSLSRLLEITNSVKNVYPPGAKIIVLMDGFRFKDICYFLDINIKLYQEHLLMLLKLLNGEHTNSDIILVDYNNKTTQIDIEARNNLAKYKEYFHHEYTKRLGDMISLDAPYSYLKHLAKDDKSDTNQVLNLFRSLIYSIYFPEVYQEESDSLTKSVYEYPFNFENYPKDIVNLKKELLRRTWISTLSYVSEIAAGRSIKPIELIYPHSIRCDMHMIPDRYTFYSVNRSTTLTSFHSTGYINSMGKMGVNFRAELKKACFSPVYINSNKFPYTKQAFCYVPENFSHKDTLNFFSTGPI